MLDQIDLDRSISKDVYHERLPNLQARLYDLEQAISAARIPVVIVFEGWAGTSKIGTIGLLTRRMDPRGLRVYPITPPRTFESQYPWLYRFWLKTPRYGELAIFDRSWYREVLADRTREDLPAPVWQAHCEDIVAFERQLADDGAVILKFWLHIARQEQARRFKQLLGSKLTAWQVTDEDRWQHRHYKRVRSAVEDLLSRTDTPTAPWVVVPATDQHFLHITVMETILKTLETRLGQVMPLLPEDREEGFDQSSQLLWQRVAALARNGSGSPPRLTHTTVVLPEVAPGILKRVDLTHRLDEPTYEHRLARLQARLHLLGREVYQQKRPVLLVFEGWDAAGKGGTIQRITAQLDPRSYIVHTIAAPEGDDKTHHYLYRFWRRLPPRGEIAIFDRSWYGRVLVERVEGFARQDEWQRAYAEINEFERQLVAFGTIVCKFWLHISPEEQLRRFEERQKVPYKAWKLTEEDWRNREKWPCYEHAADEMLLRTSTPAAPWTIVESEDKRFGRIKVLRTIVHRLEAELGKVKL